MRFGITVPNFGPFFDPRVVADLGRAADEHGWDGFFVWDHIHGVWERGMPTADPWVLLTATVLATERIRIGPLVTPVPRRRPWKLARETVSLDHLSGGRLTLGVGLGYPPDLEYGALGEEPDDRVRAGKLDEGLEVLTRLWSGKPCDFAGEHFRLDDVVFAPRPLQDRIPIWVAGVWPTRAPFRRAARWDGTFPIGEDGMGLRVDAFRECAAFLREKRSGGGAFDLVAGRPVDSIDEIAGYAEAGATWWMESDMEPDDLMARIRAGPPDA